jgi:hypothetical protein
MDTPPPLSADGVGINTSAGVTMHSKITDPGDVEAGMKRRHHSNIPDEDFSLFDRSFSREEDRGGSCSIATPTHLWSVGRSVGEGQGMEIGTGK